MRGLEQGLKGRKMLQAACKRVASVAICALAPLFAFCAQVQAATAWELSNWQFRKQITKRTHQLIVSFAAALLFCCSGLNAATTWYVDSSKANGTGTSASPFNTITNAVNAAAAGDTLYVAQGNGYNENLLIAKALNIYGGWNSAFAARYVNSANMSTLSKLTPAVTKTAIITYGGATGLKHVAGS